MMYAGQTKNKGLDMMKYKFSVDLRDKGGQLLLADLRLRGQNGAGRAGGGGGERIVITSYVYLGDGRI